MRIFGIVGLAMLVGCGTAPSSNESSADDDLVSTEFEASPETRDAIGVYTWEVSDDGEDTIVLGYDDSRAPIVDVRENVAYGEGVYHVVTKVSAERASATMAIEATDDEDVAIQMNALAKNTAARRVLERLEADAAAQDEAPATSSSLTRPQSQVSLVGKQTKLATKCLQGLLKAVQVAIKAMTSCALVEALNAPPSICKASIGKVVTKAKSATNACGAKKKAKAKAKPKSQTKGKDEASKGGGASLVTPSKGAPSSPSSPSGKSPSSSPSGEPASPSGETPSKETPAETPSKETPGETPAEGTAGETPAEGTPEGSPEASSETPPDQALATTCNATESPFTLPLESGAKTIVSHGNDGTFTHNAPTSRHAFDFELAAEAPLHAIGDGVVAKLSDATKPGMPCHDGGGIECIDKANFVLLSHPDGRDSLYMHLSSVKVTIGQQIERGEVIGLVGSSGHSTGPHAHVQLQERCSKTVCPTVPLMFADVPNGGVPASGAEVTSCR